MKHLKETELLREELIGNMSGGQIVNRDVLEDYIRRMKALGHSKAVAVGTVTTAPEVREFSTLPWDDIVELRHLASEIYDCA